MDKETKVYTVTIGSTRLMMHNDPSSVASSTGNLITVMVVGIYCGTVLLKCGGPGNNDRDLYQKKNGNF